MTGFFTRYCLNILGVNSTLLATFLLIWNIWDPVNDPLTGALLDKLFAKSRHPKGKFRPWILCSTPMVCISTIALWTVPTLLNGVAMLAALFILKILYEGSYTVFNVSMGSLLSAMADSDADRSALSSAREFGATIGGYAALLLFPVILEIFGDNATGFGIGATILAVIGSALCFLHYAWTEERKIVNASDNTAEQIKFTDILTVFRQNRAFVAMCLQALCITCATTISTQVSTYMYEDVLGSIGLMSVSSLLALPISIFFLIMAPKLAQKIELVKVIRGCLLIDAALYISLFAVMLVVDINAWGFIIWSAVALGFASVSNQMQWGLMGETIDYNDFLPGKRTEGSIYGTFSLARRIGSTVASSVAVLMLGWICYDAALATQASGTIVGIKALSLQAPGIFVLGSWAVFQFIWNIPPAVREKITVWKESETQAAE